MSPKKDAAARVNDLEARHVAALIDRRTAIENFAASRGQQGWMAGEIDALTWAIERDDPDGARLEAAQRYVRLVRR